MNFNLFTLMAVSALALLVSPCAKAEYLSIACSETIEKMEGRPGTGGYIHQGPYVFTAMNPTYALDAS